MTRERRGITIVVHREGQVESRTYRFPIWAVRLGSITGIALLTLGLLLVVTYGPIVRAAIRVPFLTREIERLSAENRQVQQLARRLETMEARYAQIRSMMGGDVLPVPNRGLEALVMALPLVASLADRVPADTGPTTPQRWPLDDAGVVTRGQIGEGSADEAHPGVDIAVATGTPIRAAGGGRVVEAGQDPDYGLFVLIEHPDGYGTKYGHASRLLVSVGDQVAVGDVIALSGSTGRSTAPHLHFEIRRGNRSIDPRSLLKGDSE